MKKYELIIILDSGDVVEIPLKEGREPEIELKDTRTFVIDKKDNSIVFVISGNQTAYLTDGEER